MPEFLKGNYKVNVKIEDKAEGADATDESPRDSHHQAPPTTTIPATTAAVAVVNQPGRLMRHATVV